MKKIALCVAFAVLFTTVFGVFASAVDVESGKAVVTLELFGLTEEDGNVTYTGTVDSDGYPTDEFGVAVQLETGNVPFCRYKVTVNWDPDVIEYVEYSDVDGDYLSCYEGTVTTAVGGIVTTNDLNAADGQIIFSNVSAKNFQKKKTDIYACTIGFIYFKPISDEAANATISFSYTEVKDATPALIPSVGKSLSFTLNRAHEHNYVPTVVDPTCEDEGYISFTCDGCGDSYDADFVDPLGHNYIATVYQPTSTSQGYTRYTCSRCGDFYDDNFVSPLDPGEVENGKAVVSLELFGLTEEDGNVTYTGTDTDGYPDDEFGVAVRLATGNVPFCYYKITVNWDPDVIEYVEYADIRDGDYLEIRSDPALLYGNFTYNDTNAGSGTFIFNRVNASDFQTSGKTKTDIYDAVCAYIYFKPISDAPANTTISITYTEVKNSSPALIPSESYPLTVMLNGGAVPEHDHNYVPFVTEPTCEEGGYTTYVCDVCHDSYLDDFTDALGHTPGEEADCEHDQICLVCYKVLVEAYGHNYLPTETVEPKCEEGGYTTYVCEHCGDSYDDDFTDPLGHNYLPTETVEPKCEEGGYTTYVCDVCHDSYNDDFTDALGHTPGEEADCEHDQICLVCYKVLVEAYGHNYLPYVTDPTCEEGGYTTYVCDNCGDSYDDDFTDPLGHNYLPTETVEPKCEEGGYTTYVCEHCGDSYDADFTDPIDHSYAPTETVAPKCEEYGYTVYVCDNCGDSYNDEFVDPLGHDFSGDAKDNGDGTHSYKCLNCDEYGEPEDHTGMQDHVCDICGYEDELPRIRFALGNTTAASGDTFTLDLTVEGDVVVDGLLLFGLNYDVSKLEFIGFKDYGDLVTNSLMGEPSISGGTINLGYLPANVPNGKICTLEFRILEGVEECETLVGFDITTASYNRKPVISSIEGGTVTVLNWLRGDFNLDGVVDMQDAVHFIGWVNYPYLPELYPMIYNGNKDFNNDGVIDLYDASYFIGWVNFSFTGLYDIEW